MTRLTPVLQSSKETEISEIFSSMQGEGPWLGVKQIFVRFGRCNMKCHYCDELPKMQEGRFDRKKINEVLSVIKDLELLKGPHHSISLTGGEPLYYPLFIKPFLKELKSQGFNSYLETNGTLPNVLEDVIENVDITAMDIKPPSGTDDKAFWSEHERFLKIASRKKVFTKLVVTEDLTAADAERAVELVASVDKEIPFVLQPQSGAVSAESIMQSRLYKEAFKVLRDVRIIHQMHKVWSIR